jgi:hypothetical protein
MVLSFGLPLMVQNALFDVVCVAVNGRISGFVAKQFLVGDCRALAGDLKTLDTLWTMSPLCHNLSRPVSKL